MEPGDTRVQIFHWIKPWLSIIHRSWLMMFHAVTHFAQLTHGTMSSLVFDLHYQLPLSPRDTLCYHLRLPLAQVKCCQNWFLIDLPLLWSPPVFWCLIAKCTVCNIICWINFTVSVCELWWPLGWWVMSVEGVYVMGDTLVYLSLSLLLCGLSRITALNQSADSAKRPRENSPIPAK